MLLTIVLTCFA